MPDPQPQRLRAMIYARSENNVIGQNGQIPWMYKGDLRRFKRLTMGSAIVMGRRTFVSIGRALPGRKNIVLTSSPLPPIGIDGGDVLTAPRIEEALQLAGDQDVWFIGGAQVYAAAMSVVDLIDETLVPIRVEVPSHPLDPHLEPVSFGSAVVFGPQIDLDVFEAGELVQHEDEPVLKRRVYRRRVGR